jgi:hypothetical protein
LCIFVFHWLVQLTSVLLNSRRSFPVCSY